MRTTIFYAIILSLIGISLSNCTGSKKIADSEKEVNNLDSEAILRSIRNQTLDFQYLNMNASLNVDVEMFTGNLGSKIRIVKDSLIWMSVSKFGFEGARILMTKDSIFALERLEKTYLKLSYDQISEEIGFNITFEFVEDFFTGKPYLDENENRIEFMGRDTIVIGPMIENFDVSHIFNTSTLLLFSTDINDYRNGISTNLQYNDYRELENSYNFAFQRNLYVKDSTDEEYSIEIKISNPEINIEKTLPFSIPERYTLRTL